MPGWGGRDGGRVRRRRDATSVCQPKAKKAREQVSATTVVDIVEGDNDLTQHHPSDPATLRLGPPILLPSFFLHHHLCCFERGIGR